MVSKRIRILLAVFGWMILLVAASAILILSRQDSKDYLRLYVLNPLPSSLRSYRKLEFSRPTLGEGHLVVAFEIDPVDFAKVLSAHPWKPGSITEGTSLSQRFETLWPSDAAGATRYSVEFGESHRWAELIVSRDRTKVVIDLFGI